MKIIHSPGIFPQTPTALTQRWLYWNVPAYFAATWIRHARENFNSNQSSSSGDMTGSMMWEEIDWSPNVDVDVEKMDLGLKLQQVTALLIGIERDHLPIMIKNLRKIRDYWTSTCVAGHEVHSRSFLIALSWDLDPARKRSLLEMGADYVVDDVTSVPRLTKMIARNGNSFASPSHPFLTTDTRSSSS